MSSLKKKISMLILGNEQNRGEKCRMCRRPTTKKYAADGISFCSAGCRNHYKRFAPKQKVVP